jgi:hypothetical protein
MSALEYDILSSDDLTFYLCDLGGIQSRRLQTDIGDC